MASLRSLPSIDALANELAEILPRGLAVIAARAAVDEARATIRAGGDASASEIGLRRARELNLRRPQRVINATGVLLHTNLGRAPVHPTAAAAASATSTAYGNVEFDLGSGRRGGRGAYLARLLTALTGAEAAHVVNNNAAALLLALATLAPGREVPVSRGELIEIGGSYRLPELMAVSTARLVEIGTTNRTRLTDYERAVSESTGMLLKVHPSNYRVVGFVEEADTTQLVALGRRRGVPVVFDIGSGLLDQEVPWIGGPPPPWLQDEPGVRQEVARGVDVILFSGDKLLGGPQAGIIVGSSETVTAMRQHPLARALRIDGATMASLCATLELYLDDRGAQVPFWSSALTPSDQLEQRLHGLGCDRLIVEAGASLLGAGSVPGLEIPTAVGRIPGAGNIWPQLLEQPTPIVARRDQGDLVIDLRAVSESDDAAVEAALGTLL